MENGLKDELFDDDFGIIDSSSNKFILKPKGFYLNINVIIISILSLVLLSLCVIYLIRTDGFNLYVLKKLSKELSVVTELTTFNDGTVSFKLNSNDISLSLDDSKCSYYVMVDGNFIKSSSTEFLNSSLVSGLKVAPNTSSNILLYSIDNPIQGKENVQELIGLKSSSRFIEISEGYLIEVHNSNPSDKNVVFFNEKGEFSSEPIYENYFASDVENFQIIIPKTYDVEIITAKIVDYLDNR